MMTCDDQNLRHVGLWGYFRRMPRILSFLARKVYREQGALLGRDPDPAECVEPLGVSIAGLVSFRQALGRQQNLSPSKYEVFAMKLAECVLRRFWQFAAARSP